MANGLTFSGITVDESTALSYADLVNAKAQLQQSQLRGQAMATTDYSSWASTSGGWATTGTAASGGFVSVDLAYEEPVKLTPIQEMRAGLKSWLG